MGVALAPYLPGGPLKRALQGQPLVDPSWVLARDTDGAFDRHVLFGASAAQYVTWVSGTAIGAFVGTGQIDPDSLGVDAMFPAFFLILLLDELRRPGMRGVALGGRADRGRAGAADPDRRTGAGGQRSRAGRACAAARTRPRPIGVRRERPVGGAGGRLRGHGLRDQGARTRSCSAAGRCPSACARWCSWWPRRCWRRWWSPRRWPRATSSSWTPRPRGGRRRRGRLVPRALDVCLLLAAGVTGGLRALG